MPTPRPLDAVEHALREPLQRPAKRTCETCGGGYKSRTPSWMDYPRQCPECATKREGGSLHRLLHAIFNVPLEGEGEACPLPPPAEEVP